MKAPTRSVSWLGVSTCLIDQLKTELQSKRQVSFRKNLWCMRRRTSSRTLSNNTRTWFKTYQSPKRSSRCWQKCKMQPSTQTLLQTRFTRTCQALTFSQASISMALKTFNSQQMPIAKRNINTFSRPYSMERLRAKLWCRTFVMRCNRPDRPAQPTESLAGSSTNLILFRQLKVAL